MNAAAIEATQLIVDQVQLHWAGGARDKVTDHAAVEQLMLGRILKAYQLRNVDRFIWLRRDKADVNGRLA